MTLAHERGTGGNVFPLVAAVPEGEIIVEPEFGNKFVPEFDRLLGSWSVVGSEAPASSCLIVSKMEFNFSKVPDGEDDAEYRVDSVYSLRYGCCCGAAASGSGHAKVDEITGQLATRMQTNKGVSLYILTSQGNGKFTTFGNGQSGTLRIVGPNKYIIEAQKAKISMERS